MEKPDLPDGIDVGIVRRLECKDCGKVSRTRPNCGCGSPFLEQKIIFQLKIKK